MRRYDGFTLFEICLAVVIGLMLLGLAVPSVTGLLKERKLKATFEAFDDFVRQAQLKSVTERRAYLMVFDKQGITLGPEEMTDEDKTADLARFDLEEGASLTFERPAALEKLPPPEWVFWRSGTCEPAVVSFAGAEGSWVTRYDPLTVRGTFLEQNLP